MTFINTGTITASRPFDEKDRAIIVEILGEPCDWFEIREDSLEFKGFPSGSLDDAVDNIVDSLGNHGIRLEGRIDYEGSYEGAYLWRAGEHHSEKSHDEVAIMDAGDQELINELNERGYNMQGLRKIRQHMLDGIAEQNAEAASEIFKLPHTAAEGEWLYERLTTLSAKESIALASAMISGIPESAAEAVNLLKTLPDHCVCFDAADYESLGKHYLEQRGIELPDATLEHTDLYTLGTMFEDEHPGHFLDDCYVMFPTAPLSAPYDGYNPNTLRDESWSVKVKLASPSTPNGVWLRLPDYSDATDIEGLEEVEAALRALGAGSLDECTIISAKCILPEAGDLMQQYDSAEQLMSDGNDLGALLDGSGRGLSYLRATLTAAREHEECDTLAEVLESLRRYDFIPRDGRIEYAKDELRKCGLPDEWIDAGVVELEDFADELLEQQGYRLDKTGNVYLRLCQQEQQMAQGAMAMEQRM